MISKHVNLFVMILVTLMFGGVTQTVNANTDAEQTLWLDELDLGKTECGWQTTTSRKSVEGNPLRLRGKTYARGIGHHAPGKILIALPPFDASFHCEVGIDDETNGQGHAEFLVYGDGNLLWRSGFLTGKDAAKPCELTLSKIKRLMLVMDTGPEGYGHDHGDWLDARLVFHGDAALAKQVRTISLANVIVDETGMEIEKSDENACEFLALSRELTKGIEPFRAAQAQRPDATFLASDRDPVDVVLRRTRALWDHLRDKNEDFPETDGKVLDALEKRNREIALEDKPARKVLFAEVTALREKIALQNPLLNFRDVLFIKRHVNGEPERQGNHMCDQFFGFHAQPGGGLFVLQNAFEPEKRNVKNLLEDSPVLHGRLAGKTLDASWGYLSPALSFDGSTILFAAADATLPRHTYTWSPENCYHLFQVNRDGSGLIQLTDGPWNDFDPCFLPNGRICFISERRGGFGRCHARPVPSYTLHSMLPDGRDIVTLSPHETNEWAPMVDNSGMIVYTRWDYVDRGFNQAHHPWITTPDGRDPRAIQGNYSERENSRPHFETSFRAIPNSHKLIGTAQGHHTQYFGSVILLDPSVPDDEEGGDAMNSLRRTTPEQLFPENENAAHRDAANYGQPFPLDEDFHLVVYDAFSGMGKGSANNYGLYLLDSFGNKILLYRDENISVQSPIALIPREKPPVIPHQTLVALPPGMTNPNDEPLPEFGIVGVSDIYVTNRPFPADTKIKEMRIVQVLPKTTPDCNVPWIGYGHDKGARKVLGTVPVAEDGSVWFELPVNVPVYLQALDEHGVAVQTMRSATYVKPGETLVCLGCHEGRQRSTIRPSHAPAAFRNAPAKIVPEMAGSNPLSYPRLIQPIWDKHCVSCHTNDEGPSAEHRAFSLQRGSGERHFFDSYLHLRPHVFVFNSVHQRQTPELWDPLPNHGGAWDSWNTARTFPGKFGANASPLWSTLKAGHYDVALSKEELRAISLWLDNNADFYGAYELDTLEEQRQGKIVHPSLE